MRYRQFALAFGFILGVGFMLPFTLAFRAPAAAETGPTLQQLNDRLTVAEKALQLRVTPSTLSDTVQGLDEQINTLQSRVGSLEKARDSQFTINQSTATAIKTLQDDDGGAKFAIGILNAAANISGKNGDVSLQQIAASVNQLQADLSSLKSTYGQHTHCLQSLRMSLFPGEFHLPGGLSFVASPVHFAAVSSQNFMATTYPQAPSACSTGS
jgi:prefoldin subunit 5